LIGFDDKGAFRHVYETRQRDLPAKTFLALMAAKGRIMKQIIDRGQFAALPGVEEFVRALWRKKPLAICSGALREEIDGMLQGISLRDCFSVIVGAEDVPIGKPDPRGYLMTTQLLSEKVGKPMAPADCLIIEDAPTVIAAVKKEGFPVLAVTTSYSADKLKSADWVVSSLKLEEVAAAVPRLAASWKET
jgi:beta-phosphoglucomutase